MIDDVSLSTYQFGKLCICAVRYALGRRTWVPDDVATIIKRRIGALSDNDITVIARDIKEYLTKASQNENVAVWVDLVGWLNIEIHKRGLEEQ